MDKRRNTTPAGRIAEQHQSKSTPDSEIPLIETSRREAYEKREKTSIAHDQMSILMSVWDQRQTSVQGYLEVPGVIPYDELIELEETSGASYTINHHAEQPPFNKYTPFVLDTDYFAQNNLVGRPVSEVMQHLIDKFSDKYSFPDFRLAQWYKQNRGETNESDFDISDGCTYILPGSRIVRGGGRTGIAAYQIQFKELMYTVVDLDAEWERGMWVILLKKKE
jgi:hypothetical protein